MLKDEIEKVLEEYALRVDSGEYVDDDEKLCLKCLIVETKKFTTRILELVEKDFKIYNEYIDLLKAELDEVVPLAYTHGWRSSRYEQGKKLREALAEIKRRMEK